MVFLGGGPYSFLAGVYILSSCYTPYILRVLIYLLMFLCSVTRS